ncbi:MAG: PilC/PilY family type IV pilus protein, partial [Gammaproteobacteria bacterium]
LNMAKAALAATIKQYAAVTDFGLMDFGVESSPRLYDTWVYYMSQTGGFTYTNTAGSDTYPNPCYNVTSTACSRLDNSGVVGSGVTSDKYLVAAASSDAPDINDVLYASGDLPSVFLAYNGIYNGNNGQSITSPYPPNFSLGDYKAGNVLVQYNSGVGVNYFATGPTNAGYVPYSPQVLYAARGFGYYSSPSNTSTPLVPVGQNQASAFSQYLEPETNASAVGGIKADAENAPIAGLLKSALNYYTNTNPSSNDGCKTQRYVVLVTDGLPTYDLDGNNWPPVGSAAAKGYGVTFSYDASNETVTTSSEAVNDAISEIKALKKAGVKTYVVGLGAGVDPSKNPDAADTLTAMAAAGGTGNYFAATSPAEVASDMGTIMNKVQAANMATSTAAVDSTSLTTLTQVFQSRFSSVTSPYGDWTGNLYSFPVDSQGNVDTKPADANWQAQSQLDALVANGGWNSQRRIVTWNPSLDTGVPFRWDSSNSAVSISQTQLNELKATSTDTTAQAVARLDYLRGDQSGEDHSNCKNPGSFRCRSHILGDIVDSAPVYVHVPRGPYTDPSYEAFRAAEKNRLPMIYVGADDGMLHAFDASKSGGGKEEYAFIPNGVFNHLIDLTEPTYTSNNAHRFYVDGAPTAGDVMFSDGSWHTILVGGLRNGGSSIYALDVTNPPASSATEAQIANNVLWEFTDSDLGKTYSRPMIARLHGPNSSASTPQFVAVFGSGYNNSDQKPYLYFVNAQTGALVDKMDLCAQQSSACDTTKANGLASPALVAPNGDGIDTRVYVGDLQGNMWKVDISNADPSKWTASVLFTATGPNGNPQPITTAPAVSLHPLYPAKQGYMVYFGTGRFLGSTDIPTGTSTPQTQTFYGVWDQPTNGNGSALTRSALQAQTLSLVNTTNPLFNGQTQVRMLTSHTVDWSKQSGWYIDFDVPAGSGERVITNPVLESGRLIFTTFTPAQAGDVCTGGGQSWLMVVNYTNGGAFPAPEIDLNNDGKLNAQDQVNGSNPAGMPMGDGLASQPTVVQQGPGANGDTKLVNRSTGVITTVHERGGSVSGRVSWRQIK